MYVREGSNGRAQKNPKPCMHSNSRLESILNVMHSLPSFPSSLQISDSDESLSLLNDSVLNAAFVFSLTNVDSLPFVI